MTLKESLCASGGCFQSQVESQYRVQMSFPLTLSASGVKPTSGVKSTEKQHTRTI